MARAQSTGGTRAVVGLSERHNRFIQSLIEMVRRRTGVSPSRSDVLRVLIETAMGSELSEADVDEAYAKAYGLAVLTHSRRAIEAQLRQTEADLRLALVHCPQDGSAARIIRRNVRYQMDRLEALDVQLGQWQQANGVGGNGAAHLVHALLLRYLNLG